MVLHLIAAKSSWRFCIHDDWRFCIHDSCRLLSISVFLSSYMFMSFHEVFSFIDHTTGLRLKVAQHFHSWTIHMVFN